MNNQLLTMNNWDMTLKCRGLTLIELVIVISIIGILIFLAIPVMSVNSLDGAAKMLCSDLNYARMQAIKKKNNFRVIVQDDGKMYQIHNDQNNNGKIDEGEKVINKSMDGNFREITLAANRNPTFNPFGTVNPGTITLSNQSESQYVIFSWTGRIRISDTSP